MLDNPRNMRTPALGLATASGAFNQTFSFTVASNEPDRLSETRIVLENGGIALHKSKLLSDMSGTAMRTLSTAIYDWW